MCLFLCVRERERERGGETETPEIDLGLWVYSFPHPLLPPFAIHVVRKFVIK